MQPHVDDPAGQPRAGGEQRIAPVHRFEWHAAEVHRHLQRRTVLVAGSVAVFSSSVVGYGESRKLPAPSYPQPDASLPSRWA